MRNLRNIRYNAWDTSTSFHGSAITSSCWDPAKDEILCTLGPDAIDGRIRLLRILEHVRASSIDVECQEVASWEAPSPNPDLAVDRVVSLHHFADSLTTCLVLEGGDIVIVVESEGQSSSDSVYIEIKGSIDEGITAASWSPDEELLAITTKAKTVVFMSRMFDGITDVAMTVEDLNASKHVSVGWGKKETQFQGRGAKALKDPTIPEKVDQGIISPADDSKTSISWRGDGAYVAISAIENGIRRVIRVYSRDGVLDSASEPVDHMDSALSWRPAGNLIASIQRLEDRVDVIFFERNGLRHGQFSLRPPKDRTLIGDKIDLSWNSDSTVLAVTLDERIQLWTMGNYHWYLKQEIFTRDQPTEIVWHPEKPLRLGAAIAGKLIQAEYIFEVAHGSLSPPYDYGAVAVIDGQSLKVTSFRTANVPPPMAMFELPISSSAVDVAFSPANSFMAILHQTGVDLYEWITQQPKSLRPRLIGTTQFAKEHPGDHLSPLQIFVTETFSIHCLCSGREGLLIFSQGFDRSNGEFSPGSTMYSGSIFGFSRLTQAISEDVVAQDALGKLHGIANQADELYSVRHNSQLPWSEVIDLAGNVIAIGLSRNGHLYANTRLLLKNCTSFLITPAHLILTTTNHLLKFIHLTDVDLMEVPPDDPETDERCRSIERGGRLVTAMPTNMSLVLQMPRGNLETIFPRAMVVAGIRKLIEALDYARAFAFCRTQRVDMNILYDHKPTQFLSHIGLFLDQVQDIANIDLFLSSLRDEDVTQTMYRDTKVSKDESRTTEQSTQQNLASGDVSKVNMICDAVLSHLQSRNTKDHGTLQNIITANICKSPPAFEDGLRVVVTLMKEDDKLAETAVEHICFLADVNTLYDEALGLYHLDLALLVAQQSQRDPREYLPFIQNLHQLPELRMKFTIDDHLSRREKALSHLTDMNAHKEAQDYIVKHSLYLAALKLYRYDTTNLALLRGLYATYLESKSKYRDAGLIYESLQDYTAATRCYRAAGVSCWRECLFAAHQQTPAPAPDALNELATTLAEAVYEAKDYAAAATIHLEHLGSLEAAIPCLCKGYLFADAMRLCIQRQKTSLLSTLVDTGIADSLGSTTEFLADCKSQLLAQVPRIAELRRKAAQNPLGFYEGERAGGADVPDDVSVAASSRVTHGGASLFTRYTGKNSVGTLGTGVSRATSKNRRREEKKRARGRKGTVYEEEYLVNSVRRLVERLETTRPDIDRLVAALVRRSMVDRAKAVESLAADVVEACQKAVKEVFPGGKEEQKEVEQGAEEEWRPMGGDAVFADALEAAWRKQEPPVIATFERMSLLG